MTVTAAFTPLLGCADQHDTISNPPEVCGPTGCVPVVEPDAGAKCPAATPTEGTQCGPTPGTGCSYDAQVARCGDAGWELVDTDCPAREPRSGSACATPPSQSCDYGFHCEGRPTHATRCVAGAWQLEISSCNPPYVPCPTQQPAAGDSCMPGGWTQTECSYGECDAGGPAVHMTCDGNQWVVKSTCGQVCPEQQPQNGTPCAVAAPSCNYGDCYGAATTFATCTEGRWRVVEATCNPPPPGP